MQAMTHPTTMDKLKWIASAGGPLILISEKSYNLWSGILKRSSYLDNQIENNNDFLNAEETDYGKACLVQDYLGIVNVGNDTALVLGDEPLLTTVFLSVDSRVVIARWYYGEDEESVDSYLKTIDLNSIDNWEFSLTLKLSCSKQYLVDSACSASMLDKGNNDYLSLNIKQGHYKIWTSIFEPDDKTKLILHKFDTTN
jgi:hypothetical protein